MLTTKRAPRFLPSSLRQPFLLVCRAITSRTGPSFKKKPVSLPLSPIPFCAPPTCCRPLGYAIRRTVANCIGEKRNGNMSISSVAASYISRLQQFGSKVSIVDAVQLHMLRPIDLLRWNVEQARIHSTHQRFIFLSLSSMKLVSAVRVVSSSSVLSRNVALQALLRNAVVVLPQARCANTAVLSMTCLTKGTELQHHIHALSSALQRARVVCVLQAAANSAVYKHCSLGDGRSELHVAPLGGRTALETIASIRSRVPTVSLLHRTCHGHKNVRQSPTPSWCVVASAYRNTLHVPTSAVVDLVLCALVGASLWREAAEYFYFLTSAGTPVSDSAVRLACAACRRVPNLAALAPAFMDDVIVLAGALLEHVGFVSVCVRRWLFLLL